MRKLWQIFIAIFVFSFAVLGWVGTEIFRQAPLIPREVVTTEGQVLIAAEEISNGQNVWDRNIAITTRLVDTVTTPMLLKVVRSGKLQPSKLVTHRFALNDIMRAYDTFGNAAKEGALKVVLTNSAAG